MPAQSRHQKNLYRPVKLIILFGYSEFSYAREAVQLGAVDYLLKPVQVADLQRLVKEAADDVRTQLRDSGDLDAYRLKRRQRQLSCWLQGGENAQAALAQIDKRPPDAWRYLGVAAFDRPPQGGGVRVRRACVYWI